MSKIGLYTKKGREIKLFYRFFKSKGYENKNLN